MNTHKSARLSQAAEPAQAAPDRFSRLHASSTRLRRTTSRQIRKAREKRWSSPRIAQHYDIALLTVTAELRRWRMNTLAALERPRPVVRHQRPHPGELVHLDIKMLGETARIGHRIHGRREPRVRGIGCEFLHVAIDDHARLTYAEGLPDEVGKTTEAYRSLRFVTT